MAGRVAKAVPHLMTLADLSPSQIKGIVSHAHHLKQTSLPWLSPQQPGAKARSLSMPPQSLSSKSIALLFSKRSTRTRLSAETSATLLGGKALFLGRDDIQLGVNESTRDTARVIGGMCQGVFARVGDHSEIEVSTTCLGREPILTQNGFPGACTTLSRPCPERPVFTMAPNTSSRRPIDPSRTRLLVLQVGRKQQKS
jgi:aspartate carbamoyltransferase catalytic subunit